MHCSWSFPTIMLTNENVFEKQGKLFLQHIVILHWIASQHKMLQVYNTRLCVQYVYNTRLCAQYVYNTGLCVQYVCNTRLCVEYVYNTRLCAQYVYNTNTRVFVLECVHLKGVTLSGQLSSTCWQEKSTEDRDLTLSWGTFSHSLVAERSKDAKPQWRQSVS